MAAGGEALEPIMSSVAESFQHRKPVSWCKALAWIITQSRSSRAVLLTVIVFEAVLFAGFHMQRWRKALRPRHEPAIHRGEGLVIRSDGLGYYSWLRSILIDGDWSFDNEFEEHNPLNNFVPPMSPRTELNRRSNLWSIGPACVWSLTVVPVHLTLAGFGLWKSTWPADGYSLPYQLAVGFGTLAAAWLGMSCIYGTCRKAAPPLTAALATACVTLGTTVVYYSAIEGSMAHGIGTACLAALIYYWLSTYGSPRWQRWLLVGLLLGATSMVRWQLASFAILPAAEWALSVLKRYRTRPLLVQSFLTISACTLGMLIGFLPQAVAWHSVFGHWLVKPFATGHSVVCGSWLEILVGGDRGWFLWNPLALLCLLGYVKNIRRLEEPFALLLLALVLQVYLVASLWGAQAYLGASFGFRQLTESAVILAPGLALLLNYSSARQICLLAVLASILVLWNLILIDQYCFGWIPAAAGADLRTLIANVFRLACHKPVIFLGQAALAALLAWQSRLVKLATPTKMPAEGKTAAAETYRIERLDFIAP
jgi:hypothetical protein